MILPNNTGGFMLQTMLYLANQRPNESNFHELYNLPPGMDPAGEQISSFELINFADIVYRFPVTHL